MSTPIKRVRFIAMALPLAITVGCGHNSQIIDYTVSNDEYATLTEPETAAAQPAEMLASATMEKVMEAPPQQGSPEIVLASAPPKLPQLSEPVMAAALPPELITEAAKTLGAASIAEPAMAEPAMAAAKPMSMEQEPSITTAEIASTVANAEAGVAALEAKVAQLEALTVQPASSPEPQIASAIDINRLGFTPSVYTTMGLGVSRLNPNVSADDSFDTNDITEPAGQFGLGVDIGRFLSLEAHTADYGSASLSPEGRIDYKVHGISALIYAGKNLDRFRRRGLNGYARIGFNQIENKTIGDIPFDDRSSSHASFGVGAEYTTRFGLGFRADLTAYDSDVQYGQLGVLYRMGSKPSLLPKLGAAIDAPAPQQINSMELKADNPAREPAMPMALKESKHPLHDDELLSAPNYTYDYTSNQNLGGERSGKDECLMLNGALSNVTFMNGSADLTHSATMALDNVANTLMNCPNRQIVVSAHTDSNGSAFANDALSKNRARAVAIHLTGHGIGRDRVRAVSFGESRPVASNATREGRSRNRRVELEVR